MLQELAKNAKNIVLIGIVLSILIVLGNLIANYTAGWLWLTYFFKIIRLAIELLDFAVDTTTLFQIIGYTFLIQIGYWTYLGTMAVVKYLRQNQ